MTLPNDEDVLPVLGYATPEPYSAQPTPTASTWLCSAMVVVPAMLCVAVGVASLFAGARPVELFGQSCLAVFGALLIAAEFASIRGRHLPAANALVIVGNILCIPLGVLFVLSVFAAGPFGCGSLLPLVYAYAATKGHRTWARALDPNRRNRDNLDRFTGF